MNLRWVCDGSAMNPRWFVLDLRRFGAGFAAGFRRSAMGPPWVRHGSRSLATACGEEAHGRPSFALPRSVSSEQKRPPVNPQTRHSKPGQRDPQRKRPDSERAAVTLILRRSDFSAWPWLCLSPRRSPRRSRCTVELCIPSARRRSTSAQVRSTSARHRSTSAHRRSTSAHRELLCHRICSFPPTSNRPRPIVMPSFRAPRARPSYSSARSARSPRRPWVCCRRVD